MTLTEIATVALGDAAVEVSPSARPRILASRKVIEDIVARDAVVYGVSTGFGKLSDVRIPRGELAQLQLNLVRSHACGIGNPLPEPEVRAMILLRANVLTLGLSGIRFEIIEMLCKMLNCRVCPVVPEKGSVGASGDLAPLAHLALSLIGEGEAFFQGERMESREAFRRAGLEPVELQAKEGLALLNGTQAMHAVGGLALLRAKRLSRVADVSGAMSLEALKGTPVAFDPRLQNARPHPGQKAVAKHLLSILEGSEIRQSHLKEDPRIQDAYSLRCMPQVHGAVRDALSHCENVLLIESGSATDNPLVFYENGDVISGGNFHGAPLALAFDYAAIALTDLMSISERRIERIINPDMNEGLPAFLARHGIRFYDRARRCSRSAQRSKGARAPIEHRQCSYIGWKRRPRRDGNDRRIETPSDCRSWRKFAGDRAARRGGGFGTSASIESGCWRGTRFRHRQKNRAGADAGSFALRRYRACC